MSARRLCAQLAHRQSAREARSKRSLAWGDADLVSDAVGRASGRDAGWIEELG